MLRAALFGVALAFVVPGAAPAADPAPGFAYSPSWSPSGDALAYAARPPGSSRTDVYVFLNPRGPSWNVTASDPAMAHGYASWSRDGRRLVFRSDLSTPLETRFGVSVADRDGTNRKGVAASGTWGSPCFAANGSAVAFDGFEQVEAARTDGNRHWIIRSGANFPVCSLRSSHVAFAALLGNYTDVVTAGIEGTRPRRLTRAKGDDMPLAWSRDGRRILFSTQRHLFGGRHRSVALYAMDSNGRRQSRVAWAQEGDFSQDARRVVYTTPQGLYVVGVNGRGSKLIASGDRLLEPRWSPNGRWIAFTVSTPSAEGYSFRIDLVRPTGRDRHMIAP
ncbi:MAG: hypothetical protein M3R70_08050 [Actinomycetota bacterium]|nr:hypothetical protein [Actinomycetota bacterium]